MNDDLHRHCFEHACRLMYSDATQHLEAAIAARAIPLRQPSVMAATQADINLSGIPA